jgi:carboxymethylenebutenolidase
MARTTHPTISLADGTPMRGYLALPDGVAPDGGWPALLAIHDIGGFRPDIRRIARRLADSGYATLAPALFDGAGAPGICVWRTFRDYQRGEGAAFERIEAAQDCLRGEASVDSERIGITGFCLGGGFAIFYAARGGVRVCAPYYGETPKSADELRRVCPVVAGFGEDDKPFVDKGRRLARHLEALGVPHDVKIYPGVRHAYMNDHGLGPVMSKIVRGPPLYAAYDETAAEDSWRRMLAFFADHL